MNSRKTQLIALASLAVGAGFVALPASADLTVVQTTKISAPGVQQILSRIPEQQRAALGGMLSPMLTGTPWVTTTYMQGDRVRTDMGQSAVVANGASGQHFTLDKATHKFSLGAYDPFQKAAGNCGIQITPTGVTTKMLGHEVRQYSIALTSSVMPKSAISGRLWAAPDLPAPPAARFGAGSMASGFGAQMAKVRGLPLAYTLTYSGTPMGDISISSTPTGISENPLQASVFRIPSGYTQGAVQTGEQTPSALGLNSSSGGNVDASALSSGSVRQLLSSLGGLIGSVAGSPSNGGAQSSANPDAGGSAGTEAGSIGNLISPQMIQQLSSELQSLLGGDGGGNGN